MRPMRMGLLPLSPDTLVTKIESEYGPVPLLVAVVVLVRVLLVVAMLLVLLLLCVRVTLTIEERR